MAPVPKAADEVPVGVLVPADELATVTLALSSEGVPAVPTALLSGSRDPVVLPSDVVVPLLTSEVDLPAAFFSDVPAPLVAAPSSALVADPAVLPALLVLLSDVGAPPVLSESVAPAAFCWG